MPGIVVTRILKAVSAIIKLITLAEVWVTDVCAFDLMPVL